MLNQYKPEGHLIQDPENHDYLTSEIGLEKAVEKKKILEATALLCDASYDLHFDLFGMHAIMPRNEVQLMNNDETVKDIAVLTRVGKPVSFHIMGYSIDKSGKKTAILSRKSAQRECKEQYIETLIPGDIIPATVTHLESFGAFVDIGCGIVSLLSIDSISVSRITHPKDRLRVGDRIFVIVKSIDSLGRIYVSQKELLGTWEENVALFKTGETVMGTIRSIENYGVFVELTPNLAGLAEVKEDLRVNETAAVYIKSILPDRMKIKLVIIDTQPTKAALKPPKYFIDLSKTTHLSYWRYSPDYAEKRIETIFE